MLIFASGCHVSTTIGGCEKQVKNLRIQLFGGPGQIILTFAIKNRHIKYSCHLISGTAAAIVFKWEALSMPPQPKPTATPQKPTSTSTPTATPMTTLPFPIRVPFLKERRSSLIITFVFIQPRFPFFLSFSFLFLFLFNFYL